MRRRRLLVVLVSSAITVAVLITLDALPIRGRTEIGDYEPPHPLHEHPATRTVADEQPAFRLDPDKPFQIDFGRGSGWHGLETVTFADDGRVTLHRLKSKTRSKFIKWSREQVIEVSWQSAELQLPKESLASLLQSIEVNGLTTSAKAYHAENIADGTQWILRIRQGDREKVIYCNNHFPEPIRAFSARVDEVFTATGRNLTWRPASDDRAHEKELWESIKR